MALIDFNIKPGIDKQDTEVGAENRWIDSDNSRFRYGLPEKVGGWSSLISDSIVGVSRKLHAFVDLNGNRYVTIGTDKFLLLYFEGQIFDITPIKTPLASSTIATANNSPVCTITTASTHGFEPGDIVLFNSVTLPASPAIGSEVTFVDDRGTFANNNLILNRNSQPILGLTANLTVSTNGAAFTLLYVNSTRGWVYKDNI